jgi:hypothetical protein
MSATIAAPMTTGNSRIHGLRLALIALAVVVLLAGAFVIGRITVSSAQRPPAVATSGFSTPAAPPTTSFCQMGRAC